MNTRCEDNRCVQNAWIAFSLAPTSHLVFINFSGFCLLAKLEYQICYVGVCGARWRRQWKWILKIQSRVFWIFQEWFLTTACQVPLSKTQEPFEQADVFCPKPQAPSFIKFRTSKQYSIADAPRSKWKCWSGIFHAATTKHLLYYTALMLVN